MTSTSPQQLFFNPDPDWQPRRSDRLQQYEQIVSNVATGVFILEAVDRRHPGILTITLVNAMGAKFFGRPTCEVSQLLADARH